MATEPQAARRRTTLDAVATAYVWGYPLVAVHRARAAAGARAAGRLVARTRLSTAADRSVVAPNNDTLYASAWFDLSAGPVTLDVAAMDRPDRYWSVMLLDAYTNVSYVCRRLHGTAGARVQVTLDADAPHRPDESLGVVPVATPTVWMLARVVVDGPEDLGPACRALAGIRTHQTPAGPPALGDRSQSAAGSGPAAAGGSPAPRDAAERSSPPTASSEPLPVRSGPEPGMADASTAAVRWFDDLRAALAADPPAPWHPSPPPGLTGLLADPPPPDVLAAGVAAGEARLAAAGGGVDRTGNGWGTRARGAAFGDDVAYRAAFAKYSLAGHLPAENRSYSRVIDGRRPALLRFDAGEPPVAGFWSLTLYGPDMFLVDNEIGRHSIGDRTPGLCRDPDGSLTVTIGHDRPAVTANWLPAPAGPCVLVLRAYEGAASVVGATWFPPDLEPVLDAEAAPAGAPASAPPGRLA
ncbi:MAG TPA: DUF1254 domain-containing protein [Acidimicrobiales bacterium]|nr:DUF1254 domain-containing protein [Acidimicrobiales bacterium]